MAYVWYNGDWWQCVAPAMPGESPDVAPQKWVRVPVLAEWRVPLTLMTYAALLGMDGQTDKALVESQKAARKLEDVVYEAAQREAWRLRVQR